MWRKVARLNLFDQPSYIGIRLLNWLHKSPKIAFPEAGIAWSDHGKHCQLNKDVGGMTN